MTINAANLLQSSALCDIAAMLHPTYNCVVVDLLLFCPQHGTLEDICELSGVDSELWFEHPLVPGYWCLESPPEVTS